MKQDFVSESQLLRAEGLLLQLGDALGIKLRLHSDVAGDRWVADCIEEFKKANGPESVRDVSAKQLPYDLVVNGLRVQCKARTPKRGRSMSIQKWWGKPRHGAYAFDFLALKYANCRYVIPCEALTRRDGTLTNDIKPDSFWRYKEKWSLRASNGCFSSVDLPLFGCTPEVRDGR